MLVGIDLGRNLGWIGERPEELWVLFWVLKVFAEVGFCALDVWGRDELTPVRLGRKEFNWIQDVEMSSWYSRWIWACNAIHWVNSSKVGYLVCRSVTWCSYHFTLSFSSSLLNRVFWVLFSFNEAREPGRHFLKIAAAWHLCAKSERAVGRLRDTGRPWSKSKSSFWEDVWEVLYR